MAGRPPKPSAVKRLEGNPGKRALPANEPEPDLLNDLTPPKDLPDEARAVWNELAPALRRAQLLTTLDRLALEQLCVAAAQHRIATRNIGDDRLIMKNAETGSLSPSPWVIIQSMAFKRAKALMDSFGMTPAARTRVAVEPQADLFGHAPADTGTARFFNH
jgi:P27 family predicted phage terminase small subunit